MKSRPSLKDVAKEAGVSTATISRHLNGSLDLPEPTRARIEAAVSKLRYHPNPHARRLSLGRSDTIALILPDIGNPFFAKLAAAIEKAAEIHNSMVLLHATFNKSDREMAALRRAAQNQVDGVIFITNRAPEAQVAQALNEFARAVILDEDVPGGNLPRVLCDNGLGGVLAGRHLRSAGHSHVAYFCGGVDLHSTQTRLAGLRSGLAHNGDPAIEPTLFVGDHSPTSGRALAEQFLNTATHETAIFSGSDELTVGILEVFKERGVRVPDDFSIISFDDARSLHLFAPAITSVRQPVGRLGERAVEILFSDAWNEPGFKALTERMPVTLIERSSVSNPAKNKKRPDPGP
ncbi:LacI family DNA-binding transcriptional regulator [Loktanella sp. SALINAS62]|uniref:LacI family DNA-binding transcriptional regulator n=1 Tax=Loktanella sp. SALINAS62 TaxID=2706124 RepID=UPI001B8B723B|nr:LacI family DNA-binding transcriptional regulator [Loktanella sp. SALINAS62]MBS1302617.1 LacI family transcriptional regulator [Loktanella sp. SALINAS62]